MKAPLAGTVLGEFALLYAIAGRHGVTPAEVRKMETWEFASFCGAAIEWPEPKTEEKLGSRGRARHERQSGPTGPPPNFGVESVRQRRAVQKGEAPPEPVAPRAIDPLLSQFGALGGESE